MNRLIICLGFWLIGFSCGCQKSSSESSDSHQYWAWESIAFDVEISVKCLDVSKKKQQRIAKKLSERTTEIEQLFSLYITDSQLSQLNESGVVNESSPEFIEVIEQCVGLGNQTKGLFDVTVQPLWEYYKNLASDPELNEELDGVLSKINYQNIICNKETRSVSFKTAGMKITLNGMIQGYLTDELAKVLKAEGVKNALVNAGEYRALGKDGKKEWSVDIQSPHHHEPITTVSLTHNQALAVSAGYGHTFDIAGKSHHLFHPRNAVNQPVNRTVIVLGESSAKADALATAFAVCPKREWDGLLKTIKSHPLITIQIFEGKKMIWSSP